MRCARWAMVTVIAAAVALAGCAGRTADRAAPARDAGDEDHDDAVYQVAPLKSLLEGVYEGPTSFARVLEHGDFGLATPNPLDGEVVILDGQVWRIGTDGKPGRLDPAARTPFAVAKRFRAEARVPLASVEGFADLGRQLDARAASVNVIHAVRIDGTFDHLRLRSVPAQRRPFVRLPEVITRQTVFEVGPVQGTMVGFRFPDYMTGLNPPGYHFHFLAADRSIGGHVLDVRASDVTAGVDVATEYHLSLPRDPDFLRADLRQRDAGELLNVVQPK